MSRYQKTLKVSDIKFGQIDITSVLGEIFPKFNPDQRRNKIVLRLENEEYGVLYDNDNPRIRGLKRIF